MLLLTQASLVGCPRHSSPVWTTCIEAFLPVHAVLVAWLQNIGLKPMFFGGSLLLLAGNQICYARVPPAAKAAPLGLYVAWVAHNLRGER